MGSADARGFVKKPLGIHPQPSMTEADDIYPLGCLLPGRDKLL